MRLFNVLLGAVLGVSSLEESSFTLTDGIFTVPRADLEPLHELGLKCQDTKNEILKDGTMRRTIQTENGINDELDCPAYKESVQVMNEQMDQIVSKLNEQNKQLGELIQLGERIEHFHEYVSNGEESKEDLALDWHTDHGVLIVMTPPQYFVNGEEQSGWSSGFYVQEKDGQEREVHVPKDELVVMFGEGIAAVDTLKIQPVLHGMKMPKSNQKYTRTWFGRMYLLPKRKPDCGEGRKLVAKDKGGCDFQMCSPNDASNSQAECDLWCNDEMKSGQVKCADKCTCSGTVPNGGQVCWMLCVKDLSTDVCPPPSFQECNDPKRKLFCNKVTAPPMTPAPTTEAPTTEAPVTEAPVTEAPTTEAPTTESPVTETPSTTEAPSTVETPEAPTPATTTPVPATVDGTADEKEADANASDNNAAYRLPLFTLAVPVLMLNFFCH